jgi:hypothetical protein
MREASRAVGRAMSLGKLFLEDGVNEISSRITTSSEHRGGQQLTIHHSIAIQALTQVVKWAEDLVAEGKTYEVSINNVETLYYRII